MKRLGATVAGLWISAALSVAPAAAGPASVRPACCRVPAGTVVEVETVGQVSTQRQKPGDTFALRLAAPLVVDGKIVLRRGARGEGEVVDSAKPGLGGKGAKLVLAARYLKRRGVLVPLQGLQLAAAGHDSSTAAQAVGLTGIAFAPLGIVALAIRGGEVVFPPGTKATAKVAADVTLPSLGRASRRDIAAAFKASEPATSGSIDLSPPPAGEGQVVFFRAKSVLGAGQWFNVREDGKALGKLANGAYFAQITAPGIHKYTAATEPELKDRLKLEIAPRETYFVEGTLTKGVVIGTADLTPSDRAAFDKVSKDLKLSPPPAEATGAPPPETKPDDTTAASSRETSGGTAAAR
jgi:hypothetical protein